MSAVLKETERGRFSRGTTVLALHTGGLQGNYEL
jgi:1-aminocyclopropane-1-carboxylate deaminase/D-cysteine desulfhydrase-like pyridoxal-dependent ACC family enzyme